MARTTNSLRLRLLVATVALVALALGVAAVGFEWVARRVVTGAVREHLAARSREVEEAVVRFQRERALAVRSWAEAEAMQLTLDSGDPKFAEDYLRRLIQDQGGSIVAAALVGPEATMLAGVRAGRAGERRGVILAGQRGRSLALPPVEAALGGAPLSVQLGPASLLDGDAGDEPVLLVAVPVRDFASDLVGAVVAGLSTGAMRRLLAEIGGADGASLPVVHDGARSLVLAPPGVATEAHAALLAEPARPGELQRHAHPGTPPLLAVRTEASPEPPGWSAAMVIPEAAAFGQLRALRMVLIGLYAVVLSVAGVASLWILRAAAQPLSDVTRSMARVAEGDLTTRLPDEYPDVLGRLVRSFNAMVGEVARSRDELRRTEALRRELQIAHRIQTAILPVRPAVPGWEVAARMQPAQDVGGDLYDVVTFPDTFWVLVGDVSGHGLNSGLVMMMAQAAAHAAISRDPRGRPGDVVAAVNRVVHENVRVRMGQDDYLTLVALRHLGGGRFACAGAHQPAFLARAGGGVEVLEPAGPWLGLGPEVGTSVVERELEVRPGDVLCLVTDGVLEAAGPGGELFGEDRLAAVLGEAPARTAAETLTAVFQRVEGFMTEQSDDITTVVLRRTDDHRA